MVNKLGVKVVITAIPELSVVYENAPALLDDGSTSANDPSTKS